MKSVKSAAELKRLALRQGAVVDMAGRKFNAGGAKAAVKAPKPQAPAPTPAPVEVAPPPPVNVAPNISIDTSPLAQEIAVANARTERLFQALLESRSEDRQRTAYRAVVQRDEEGRIQYIDLIPKE